MNYTFTLCLMFACFMHLTAQTNCYFTPDKEKILHNKNLDYFLNNTRNPFKNSYEVKDIPPYIREQFNCLTEDTLLANPNEEYSSGCVMFEGVARRQLVFHAINSSNFIIVYHRGGFVTQTIALFMRFSDTKLIDVWVGNVDPKTKNLKELVDFIRNRLEEMKALGRENTFGERDYISF